MQAHADHKAALVLAARWGDQALAACKTKEAVNSIMIKFMEELAGLSTRSEERKRN